jgi:hypothetical protein
LGGAQFNKVEERQFVFVPTVIQWQRQWWWMEQDAGLAG